MEYFLSQRVSIDQMDLAGKSVSQFQIVRDHNEHDALDLVEALKKIEDGLPGLCIQVPSGFIGEQDFRFQN